MDVKVFKNSEESLNSSSLKVIQANEIETELPTIINTEKPIERVK